MKKFINIVANIVAVLVYIIFPAMFSIGGTACFGHIFFNEMYPFFGIEKTICSILIGLIIFLPICLFLITATIKGYFELTQKWNKPFITVGRNVYE